MLNRKSIGKELGPILKDVFAKDIVTASISVQQGHLRSIVIAA